MMKAQHCFVLGKGLAESVAREGALKIKEITYLHAEGYPGGALKHGPFALIEEGTPIIMLILDDRELPLMVIAAEEVRGRGACTSLPLLLWVCAAYFTLSGATSACRHCGDHRQAVGSGADRARSHRNTAQRCAYGAARRPAHAAH